MHAGKCGSVVQATYQSGGPGLCPKSDYFQSVTAISQQVFLIACNLNISELLCHVLDSLDSALDPPDPLTWEW